MAIPTLKVRDWADHSKTEQQAPYTDLIPYLAEGGLKWSRNDIDAADSGRDQAAEMHRARIAIKIRIDGTCKPLTAAEASIVLKAIKPEWLQVKYYDVQEGSEQTVQMYSNNIPATFMVQRGSTQMWGGISFPLVQK